MGVKKKKEGHGTLENLFYWLKVLYRESPGFVWLYLLEIGVTIGISLLGVYLPSALVADITAGAAVEKVVQDLALLGGGLVCLYLVNQWLGQTKDVWNCKISQRQSFRLAQAAMDAKYVNIERADFPEEFGQLFERHVWSEEYTKKFMQAFTSLATAAIGMILYVGMLSGLSLWVLALIVAGTAVNYFVGIRCNKWDTKNRHKWWELDNKMSYLAGELSSYEASKDVHLYWMPPWLGEKYQKELNQRIHYTVRQQLNYYLEGIVGWLTQNIWEGVSYLYLIWLVCEGRLDAAEFVLYFGIITGFAQWCRSIVSGMRELHKEAQFVEEERQFFQKLMRDGDGEQQREDLFLEEGHIPEISFVGVSFQYPGAEEPTIQDLNLTLKPGENIALVGLNGAGKTTFIKLLCGFYDPTQGKILIDGVNRNQYKPESWLRYFSGVFQDADVFPMSIEENLDPKERGDREYLEECLRMADLEEKIQKLPQRTESKFGKGVYEDAVDFSGGEMQKLMLARALYKTAPLLVLDEPTAALDPLMESELYEQYCRFSENKTTVFISHRLASTRFCDRILLMEKGKIVEQGSHEELLDKDGKYAWMFRLQSKYYQQKEAGLEGEEVYG